LLSVAREEARWRFRLAVCASPVVAAASLTYFQTRRAQAQQTPVAVLTCPRRWKKFLSGASNFRFLFRLYM
jgi:hypothetical protein